MNKYLCLLAVLLPLVAQANEIIKPDIGEPLRDAAVTRGPDGTFYLTGTRAMARRWSLKQEGKQADYYLTESQPMLDPDGQPDFMNNDGAKVWSSRDLVNWTDEGLVWDLMGVAAGQGTYRARSYAFPDRKVKAPRVRGLTSPKFFSHDGHWFIVESYGGHDISLLRSKGADIGGPYLEFYKEPARGSGNEKVDTRVGGHDGSRGPGHGSLFTDRDGSTYLIWGPGYIVTMKPDLSMPEGADKGLPERGLLPGPAEGAPEHLLIAVAGYPNAEWCAGQFAPRAFSVTLDGDTYLLTWSAMTDGSGARREDSFIATAKSLFGPYGTPSLLAPGTGPVALFRTDAGLMASCSIDNAPALIPLERQGEAYAATGLKAEEVKPALPGKPEMFDYAHSEPSGKYHKPHPETKRSKLVPVFDLPLSETCIAKGGDGAWYMTGTVASRQGDKADFENNDGIYLWRSEDLNTWLPLGKVWDIEKDGGAWQKQYRIPADNPTCTEFARGVTAPEIAFADGTYWLAYSMNGRGTGLLKSKSGKPEGPYEDLGRIAAMGGSPSLFVEDDRALWLWGTLMAGELNAQCSALAGKPVSLYLQVGGEHMGIQQEEVIDMWDDTAPHLFTAVDPKSKKKQYYLTWSAISQGTARALRETFISRADSPLGPFSSPVLMIPHGGQTSVFEGPNGGLFASFHGADPSATFRDRPCLLPLAFGFQNMPRKVENGYYARRGPWDEPLPIPGSLTDWRLSAMPDGNMYIGGSSAMSGPQYDGTVVLWRSPDLKHWELLRDLYTHERAAREPLFPEAQPGQKDMGDRQKSWGTHLHRHHDDYYIQVGLHSVPGKASRANVLLNSTSGRPEGPYDLYAQAPTGTHTGFAAYFEDSGDLYVNDQGSNILKLTDDMKSVVTDWVTPLRDGRFALKNTDGTILSTDIPGATGYGKIDGKYLWGSLNGFRGYCLRFWVSDKLLGPLREIGTLPYAGNGMIARFKDGRWYSTFQFNRRNNLLSAPARDGTPILPLHVDLSGDDPAIEFEYDHEAGVREMSVYGEYE